MSRWYNALQGKSWADDQLLAVYNAVRVSEFDTVRVRLGCTTSLYYPEVQHGAHVG